MAGRATVRIAATGSDEFSAGCGPTLTGHRGRVAAISKALTRALRGKERVACPAIFLPSFLFTFP